MSKFTLTPTGLRDLDLCPWMWRAKKQGVLPDIAGDYALLGRQVHDFIQRYTEHCWEHGIGEDVPHGEDLIEAMMTAPDKTAVPGRLHGEFEKLCRIFLNYNDVGERPAFGGCEVAIGLDAHHEPCAWDDAVIRGRIDRCWVRDGVCFVTDYKTGWSTEPESGLNQNVQLRVGAYLVSRKFASQYIEEVQVQLQYLRFDHQKGFAKRETFFKPYELDAIRAWLLGRQEFAWAQWNAETPITTAGPHCANCPFTEQCPLWARFESEPFHFADRDRKKHLDYIGMMEARLKKMKAALKTHVSTQGPFEGETHRVAIGQREKWAYDPRSLYRIVGSEVFWTLVQANEEAVRAILKKEQREILVRASGGEGQPLDCRALLNLLRRIGLGDEFQFAIIVNNAAVKKTLTAPQLEELRAASNVMVDSSMRVVKQ